MVDQDIGKVPTVIPLWPPTTGTETFGAKDLSLDVNERSPVWKVEYSQVSQDLRHKCRSSYDIKSSDAEEPVIGVTQSAKFKQCSEIPSQKMRQCRSKDNHTFANVGGNVRQSPFRIKHAMLLEHFSDDRHGGIDWVRNDKYEGPRRRSRNARGKIAHNAGI